MIKVLERTISIAIFKKREILLLMQLSRILFKDLRMVKILSLEVSMILMIHSQKELASAKRMFRLVLMWIVSLLFQSQGNLMLGYRNKHVNFNNRSMTQTLLEMNSIDRRLSPKLKSIFWKMMTFLDCNERYI